jgi:hypothetical protein
LEGLQKRKTEGTEVIRMNPYAGFFQSDFSRLHEKLPMKYGIPPMGGASRSQ